MTRANAILLAIFATNVCACAVGQREAKLPVREEAWIAVLSGEMPEAIEQVARHAWIVGSTGYGQSLARWEYLGGADRTQTSEPFHYFGKGDVAIHGIVHGSREEIATTMRCLDKEAREFDRRHPTYFPIPGPNSNTFVAEALRNCDVHVELPSTAVGRDYRGVIGAGLTESGTGVQLESWLVGARIGLQEGVEGHVVGLALGAHIWPPGITVPVNPGRIGLDFDGRVPRYEEEEKHGRHRTKIYVEDDRRFGLGVAQMFATIARVKTPESAGGLAERATVGLSGRGIYGKREHFGYAFGLDLALGAGFPAGFAYSIYMYPTGIAYTFGPSGYVGVFGGFGASGVSARVTGGFEVPVELRAEVDATSNARVGFRAATIWIPGVDDRRGSTLLPFGDELVLGTFARFGKTRRSEWRGITGRGHFFGFERHEVMHTYWLGFTFGVEADFGG